MGSVFFKSGKEKLAKPAKTFFDMEAKDIDGNNVNFSVYKNKKAFIVVNVASSCGFTKNHYKELMELYNKYRYFFFFFFGGALFESNGGGGGGCFF